MEAEEGILEDVVGYIYASGLAVIARGAEMNAGKDTGIFDFIESRGKARKRTGALPATRRIRR